MFLNVSVLSPKEIIFEGKARSIILPGEQGTFEILPFHKRILSRLLTGELIVDGTVIPMRRGIVRAEQNTVTVIIEQS